MTEKKELSQLARQILSGGGHVTMYTQSEFDEALTLAKAEIMAIAIDTTKKAIFIEREECAKVAEEFELPALAEAIRNRIPSQRQ